MERDRQPAQQLAASSVPVFSMSAPPGAPEWPPFASGVQPRTAYRPQLSSAEWEVLRPDLKRMYIDEKKTFNVIAKWLREFHNFNPTKRQFDGKVLKWELRKNKKHVENSTKKGNGAANYKIGTIVFDPANDHSAAAAGTERTGSKSSSPKAEEEAVSVVVPEWGDSTRHSPIRSATFSSIYSEDIRMSPSGLPPAAQSDTLSLHSEPHSSVPSLEEDGQSPSSGADAQSPTTSMSTFSDTGSFTLEYKSLWDMTNIPGSPRLTGLFSALKIDKEIPLLPLHSDIPDITRPVISRGAFLITGEDEEDTFNEDRFSLSSTAKVRRSSGFPRLLDGGSKSRNVTMNSYFLQWIKLVQRNMSPLTEISPFPISKQAGSSFSAIRRFNPYKPLNVRISECQERLEKLENHLPSDNPGVIYQVQQLAELFLEVGKSKEAEMLYLKVALAKQRYYGPEHPEAVTEYLNIVLAKEQSGAHPEALALHKKLHAKIIEIFGRESELGITSLTIMGGIIYHHDKTKEAEVLQRQSLQLALSHLGRRHPIIPSLMADLGVFILANDKSQIASAERLVREGFEVDCSLYGGSEAVPLHHFGGLSWILPLAGHYEESTQLVRQQARRCFKVEGIEHFATIFNIRRVAKSLRIAGDIQSSEPKATLSYICAINFLGLEHRHAITSLEELANILDALEHWFEAATRYEELYTLRAKKYALGSAEIRTSAEPLRKCYSMQGLYRTEGEFADRLDWVINNVTATRFTTEKKARKWRWYEMDLEDEEKEQRQAKRICRRLQGADEFGAGGSENVYRAGFS